ncbi:MAG TPA: VOC family protein [Candidatus Methylacidiphilales bacterium]
MKAAALVPVLRVSDLDAALRFYVAVMGFEEDFRFGEYAGVTRDGQGLHLCMHNFQDRAVGQGAIFVFCDEVDDYHAEVKARGAAIRIEPGDRPYGIRDFTVLDPDGNCLNFGKILCP